MFELTGLPPMCYTQREEGLRQEHHPRGCRFRPLREANHGVVEELQGQEGQEAHQEEGQPKSNHRISTCVADIDDVTLDVAARNSPPIQAKARGVASRHPGAEASSRTLNSSSSRLFTSPPSSLLRPPLFLTSSINTFALFNFDGNI
jgi:hypothetical protein